MFRQVSQTIDFNVDRSNPCPVDQFCSQDFNIAENGFPMSDIRQVIETNNEELRRVLLQRLEEVPSIPNDERSDADKIRDCIPRQIQTPAEIQAFVQQFHVLHPPVQSPVTVDDSVVFDDSKGDVVGS